MRRKGVKYPHGWTLVDENIENVERVRLDPKTQRELGCLVGKHVFLEYPWAYVHRDIVTKLARSPDSSLSVFREDIEIYEAETFLVVMLSSLTKATRETSVQTCPEYPKNAWTQYTHEDILSEFMVENTEEEEDRSKEDSEKNDENKSQEKDAAQSEENEEPGEKTALELFLEARSQEMIRVIKCNAAINLYIDDIDSLSTEKEDASTTFKISVFHEQVSFADLNIITANRHVSHVSLHPKSAEYVAILYTSNPKFLNSNQEDRCTKKNEFQTRVLLWKLDDPLRPKLALQDHREIYSISFCPHDDNLLIGGCSTGQLVIWNIEDFLNNRDNRTVKLGTLTRDNLPVFRPILVSDKRRSHQLPVRTIQWIQAKHETEPNGNLTKSSVSSSLKLLTASEDCTVAVWNISVLSRPFTQGADDSDQPFQPDSRMKIQSSTESLQFTPLCFCFPSVNAQRDESSADANKYDATEKDRATKYLWIGCAEGLITCTWENTLEKDSDIVGCCWANEPGVFLVGSQDGNLEIWNIKNESNQPIFTQVVSLESISCLTLLDSPVLSDGGFKMIGVGDGGGLFRAFAEPDVSRDESMVGRMDWFEEYVWRETRKKKLFASWQSDFLANDPVLVAKRLARKEEQVKREAEEARERFRREQEERLRLQAEKRARSAPIPKDVAWKSKQFDRMKEVLLSKKNLVPSELEEKRIPLVALQAEREARLRKVRDKIDHRNDYFLNALSAKFPKLLEPRVEDLEFKESISVERGKSVEYYVRKFDEIRCKAKEMLTNNLAS
ncbi:WD repeat-containing protein 63 [Melipona quadrifasciata]|uniref:WD repeat-containing protein 63 n=1 Tax=Melipona quadrifasciata TaxID=166423 RepID=A0A0M9AAC0_9HYME|nr:WD repeat-containing protein 63 [Melipona quadrifasciata]